MIVKVAIPTKKDADIIQRLDTVNSKSAYIKGLIARNAGIEDNYSASVSFDGSAVAIDTSKSIYYLHISLNPNTDADIINILRSSYNMPDYVRSLVRDDIASNTSKSWGQLAESIGLEDYRSTAVFAFSRFHELSERLAAAGCPDKSAECADIAERLNAWIVKTTSRED